jgi:hypothetical protein
VAKMFKSTEHDDEAVMTTEASQSDLLDAEFANSSRQVRELAHRDNNELHVTLLWHPVSDALVVRVGMNATALSSRSVQSLIRLWRPSTTLMRTRRPVGPPLLLPTDVHPGKRP